MENPGLRAGSVAWATQVPVGQAPGVGEGDPPGHKTEGRGGDVLLVGLHVNSAADDDLQQEYSPLCGLLGAALHCVKHAPHLSGPQQASQMAWL